MQQHYLIDRYLVWDSPDRDYWTLGRFKVQQNDLLFLVEQIQPADGEPAIGGDVLINLMHLTIDDDDRCLPRAQVFEDLAAVRNFVAEFNKPPAEKVVKLVKS